MKMKKTLLLGLMYGMGVTLLTATLLTGCTDSQIASMGALGSSHTVQVYSGGVCIATYTSTGKVTSGEHGTRFAFRDKNTGCYTRVTGTVVVTTND